MADSPISHLPETTTTTDLSLVEVSSESGGNFSSNKMTVKNFKETYTDVGLAQEDMSNVSKSDIAARGIADEDLSNLTTTADASEIKKGVVELANEGETISGTSDTLATTPKGVAAAIASGSDKESTPEGYIRNFLTSNSSGDPDHDIDFGTGKAKSADNSTLIISTVGLTKQLDAMWAAGDNVGGLGSVADISQSSYSTNSYAVTTQTTAPKGCFIGDSGNKMYVCESAGGQIRVYQYVLATPYDPSTATFSKSYEPVTSGGNDIKFSPDGTYMIILGGSTIYTMPLGTAWEVDTVSTIKSHSTFSEESSAEGIAHSPDGSIFYIVGGNNTVYQYDLSTPFDAGTASYVNKSTNVATEETVCTGLDISAGGVNLYVIGTANNTIFEYDLSTAFDVSTATYNSISKSVSAQDTSVQGLHVDNERYYTAGDTNNSVFQYDVTTVENDKTYHPFVISDATGLITEYGFDRDINAANLMARQEVVDAGFTQYRRVLSIITDASGNIREFFLNKVSGGGVRMVYKNPIIGDYDVNNPGTGTKNTPGLSVPLGDITVNGFGRMYTNGATGTYYAVDFSQVGVSKPSPSQTTSQLVANGYARHAGSGYNIDTSSQNVSFRVNSSSTSLTVSWDTMGYTDARL